ncbi:hypothetical protein B6D60_03590 [candidate division KSB1 bacterium 4484_87]|nr:MAG: hypothetical protein B6D60_03590 [candidate division KSB1 bacterium 4484_87]
MRQLRFYFQLLLLISILFSCAPYKMKAIRANRDHRYELAIEYSLNHLKSNPHDSGVLKILDQSARGYFENTMQKIRHYEKLNNWMRVSRVSEAAYQMLSRVSQIPDTDFPGKQDLDYLQSKRDQSKFNQANELYADAMKKYNSGDQKAALSAFEKCQSLIPHFKDSDQFIDRIHKNLAEKAYRRGAQLASAGQLESALEQFELTAELVPDFLDATQRIEDLKRRLAMQYYDKAKGLFDAGDYKAALAHADKSLSFRPDFPQAATLSRQSRNKITVRLAILPFATKRLDAKFARTATDALIARTFQKKSQFVELVDRENLQRILEEQALSQTGVIDEEQAVEVGKLSGVNTIAVGTVTLISNKVTPAKKRTLTGYYEKSYRDAKGVQRKRKVPFKYAQFERRREVAVQLSYRLINVETGEIVFSDSRTERADDSAQWISSPGKFTQYLSGAEKRKIKAPHTPAAAEVLIQKAISSLADQAADHIIQKIAPF